MQADVASIDHGLDNNNSQSWVSGRDIDALPLTGGGCLVGAETGGVWVVDPNGGATPVSNSWRRPDVLTLCEAFDDENHVFAGGSGLYVSDYNSQNPLLNWIDISPQDGILHPYAIIYKVVTVSLDTNQGLRKFVVIACSDGIFSAELPATPGGLYVWRK